MRGFRTHPIAASVLLVLLLSLAGEAAGIVMFARHTTVLNNRLKTRRVASDSTGIREAPSATEGADALERARERLVEIECKLSTQWLQRVPAPGSSTDAFFDIAGFVERYRARAVSLGILIKADERFGFGTYANEGPDSGTIAAVFSQRLASEFVLDALYESQPVELRGMLRGRLQTTKPVSARGTVGAVRMNQTPPTGNGDFFAIEQRFVPELPSEAVTAALRVSFVGDTETLRGFLKRLGESACPLFVRLVEAEPEGVREIKPSGILVTHGVSAFTVTIELVDLGREPATAGAMVSPDNESFVWKKSAPQSRGSEWSYDLFTPPEIRYDSRTRAFSVRRSAVVPLQEVADEEPELIADESEPYRLRLVGLVGTQGHFLGTFENRVTDEHFLVRDGERFPGLEVSMLRFGVATGSSEPEGATSGDTSAATALVRDDVTGEERVLILQRSAFPNPLAPIDR